MKKFISTIKNAIKESGLLQSFNVRKSLAKRLEKLSEAKSVDIHFHVFSKESFKKLLDCLTADIAGNFQLMEIAGSWGNTEVVAVLKKPS